MRKLSAKRVPRQLQTNVWRCSLSMLTNLCAVPELWRKHRFTRTQEIVGFAGRKGAEEGQGWYVIQQTHWWTTVYSTSNNFKRKELSMANIMSSYCTGSPTIWKKERPHLAKKKLLFHKDNATVHTYITTMAKFIKLGYELLADMTYCLHLIHSHYFVARRKEIWIQWWNHRSNQQLVIRKLLTSLINLRGSVWR